MNVSGAELPRSRELQVSAAFVELADTLVPGFDPAAFLYRLTWHCVNLLQVDGAGVMLAGSDGRLRLLAASSERVRLVELFELGGADGPCLAAYRSGETVAMEDLARADSHWIAFAARATSDGLRSVHAIPLRLREHTLGVLNLFATAVGPLAPADRGLGRALADVATIGLGQHQLIETHRAAAEQAQGTPAARTANRKLADLARDVVTGRTFLPSEDPPGQPDDSAVTYAQRAARRAHAAFRDAERSAEAASQARQDARAAWERLTHRRHPDRPADQA